MLLSTETYIPVINNSETYMPLCANSDEESIRLIAEAGFDALDYSMFGMRKEDHFLNHCDVEAYARQLKEKIIANTQGLCTEMEGAAIAQTAYRNQIPFVILRAISDKADDSAEMDYPTFERIAAHRCAEVVMKMAASIRG